MGDCWYSAPFLNGGLAIGYSNLPGSTHRVQLTERDSLYRHQDDEKQRFSASHRHIANDASRQRCSAIWQPIEFKAIKIINK